MADPDFENTMSESESEEDASDGIRKKKRRTVGLETATKEAVMQGSENQTENKTKSSKLQKKRQLKGETRAVRKERKLKRNTGQEYTTRKGKTRAKRTIRPLKKCRNKCQDKISENDRLQLFNQYWNIGEYNRRVSYLAGLMEIKKKEISRPRTMLTNRRHNRQYTVLYHFQIHGQNIPTCKFCFIATFDETARFLGIVMQKKLANKSGIVPLDRRGAKSPPNKRTEEDIENVRSHILSVPSYESHYTRRNSQKRYLPPHITLCDLYSEYKAKYPDNPVSRFIYEREFHSLNIKIKQPKKDTCQTCDKIHMQIRLDDSNLVLKENLLKHQEEADLAYKAKSDDKCLSKDDPTRKTITFDLQQCLPTPAIQSSLAFYKRQLWTYNLTIHDCDESQAYCYMWHEALAKRGGDEIGSCIYFYIVNDLPKSVKHLVMYSDTCAGQNKNSHIAAMCMKALQDSESLETLDHKFLIPGHTHMECDTDHSLIEKKKKEIWSTNRTSS